MSSHGIEVAHRCNIPLADRPNRYHRHAEKIEPVASAYSSHFATLRGWPVSPDGIEAFIADDLGLTFLWEPGNDPDCEFYARYDPAGGSIIFNSTYEWMRDDRPDIYISVLSHEIGHVVLRHGEALDTHTGSLFDDEGITPFLNHPQFRTRELDADLVRRALAFAHEDPKIAAALRAQMTPDRYEPQWMYDQAQHFAGAFIVPCTRLQDAVGDGSLLRTWDGVHRLAKAFGCSKSFMEVRLKKLGLIIVDGSRVMPTPGSGRLTLE